MEVSVVIPVYNAAAFLADAVRSALALTAVREVVLVDDGSTDGSSELCLRLCQEDARVKLYQHPGGVNRGASLSRNLGIEKATCPFVAFLDSDDRFLPTRFDSEPRIFSEHPDADGVYGAIGVHIHDAQGQERFDRVFRSRLTTVRMALPPEQLFPAFIGTAGILDFGHFSLDGLTMRRSALMNMPRLLRNDLRIGEDTEFITRLSYHTRLYPGSIDRAVALRGVHADNRITNDPHRRASRLRMYEALWQWARTTPIDHRSQRLIARDVAHFRLLCASTVAQRVQAVGNALRYPAVLKRREASEALVSVIFGRNNGFTRLLQRLVRGLHALLWRIKGGSPPPATVLDTH